MAKSAKQIHKEMFGFIEKSMKIDGLSFEEAMESWFDLAPLRGGNVVDRGSSGDDDFEDESAGSSSCGLPLAEPSDLLTVDEVCEYLGISRATLYRHDVPGKCKIGGQVRYVKNEVEAWYRKQS